jgi:hypothetical protein
MRLRFRFKTAVTHFSPALFPRRSPWQSRLTSESLPRPGRAILALRILRNAVRVLARKVGVTKTMEQIRGWISNTGGRRFRSTPYFEYRIVRWAKDH